MRRVSAAVLVALSARVAAVDAVAACADGPACLDGASDGPVRSAALAEGRNIAARPAPVVFTPVYDGGFRANREAVNIPVNLQLHPQRRWTIGQTAYNSFTVNSALICETRDCRYEYQADHTGHQLYASFSQPVGKKLELQFTTSYFRMGDSGFSPLQHLVDDDFVDAFHENILNDPGFASEINAESGRQILHMTDGEGRTLDIEPGKTYRLPLRLDVTRYFNVNQGASSRLDVNAGLHIAVPASKISRGLSAGLSANVIRTRVLSENMDMTLAAGVAYYQTDVKTVNEQAVQFADRDDFYNINFALGLRFAGTFNAKAPCSLTLSHQTTSPLFEDGDYRIWIDRFNGNNIRSALMNHNDYGVAAFGCERKRATYQFTVIEDFGGFSQLWSNSGAHYDTDAAFSFNLSWRWGNPG